MEKKLRQVTDSIHETIYLSELESDMINTPYFYRMHDIYQSSTVYMTFPANRTKRYEHSLGTMELASSMMSSAVTNADKATQDELFKELRACFEKIVIRVYNGYNQIQAPYFAAKRSQITSVFEALRNKGQKKNMPRDAFKKAIYDHISNAVLDGCFTESALDAFQYYPTGLKQTENRNKEGIENMFLYRCLLQAVRIVALFHDVGHPPYSHIVEKVLEVIYAECVDENRKNEWNAGKADECRRILGQYMYGDEIESEAACKSQTIFNNTAMPLHSAAHERIGLSLLQSALNEIIPEEIEKVCGNQQDSVSNKITKILFYIVVTEFSIGMLIENEKLGGMLLKSFHKIVDGTLDADRFDYVVRDSRNSGVDWGQIPYKRIINSAKLVYVTEHEGKKLPGGKGAFVIAYPGKIADDIADILLIRYKIFARINFHHRCMKTAVSLQASVLELAENFLRTSEDEECINPDIEMLWSVLVFNQFGSITRRIIRWNDSWLITALHTALLALDDDDTSALADDLAEILLNRKRYYSVIKRGSDSKELVKLVFEAADITTEKLRVLYDDEYSLYLNNKRQGIAPPIQPIDKENTLNQDVFGNAYNPTDSIRRVRQLQEVMETGDLELLDQLMPLQNYNIEKTVNARLDEMKQNGVIVDYKVIINSSKRKTGLPSHRNVFEEIYLYDEEHTYFYYDNKLLERQIYPLARNVPWLFAYYVPPKDADAKVLGETVKKEIASCIGVILRERFDELFPHHGAQKI